MCLRKKQLPLSLLQAAIGQPVLVELKNGETYNGTLDSCDKFMNMVLKGTVCTSRTADHFKRCTECHIRGNTIKYICVPDEVMENMPPPKQERAPAPEDAQHHRTQQHKALDTTGTRGRGRGGHRGGRGGRGGGRGGRGGSTGV